MTFETWFLFLLAGIGMSLTPGPNGLLALTHGAMHGSRKTISTIRGGVLGLTALMALCMFGMGALAEASIWWLAVLKLFGGAYLVWLGIEVWRSPPISVMTGTTTSSAGRWELFRTGFLTAATNPKGLLFFTALLPQFIDPGRSVVLQFAIIAVTYAVTEFLVEYGFALAANRMSSWLARAGKRFNQACGAIFMAVGVALPLR